jgi:hypothetical protein
MHEIIINLTLPIDIDADSEEEANQIVEDMDAIEILEYFLGTHCVAPTDATLH